jgi:hypothetical protein
MRADRRVSLAIHFTHFVQECAVKFNSRLTAMFIICLPDLNRFIAYRYAVIEGRSKNKFSLRR